MPKYIPEIMGGLEIAAGVALGVVSGFAATPLAAMLIAAGAGSIIGGLGTLLSKGPTNGFETTERNSVAPWKVVYGQQRVGGTIVYMNMWPAPGGGAGGNDTMLDLVIILAAHGIQSVDAVLFDMQRVQIDTTAAVFRGQDGGGPMGSGPYPGTGTSFTPVQQGGITGSNPCPITSIQRSNGVVTVTTNTNIPFMIVGDQIEIKDGGNASILADNFLTGKFQVEQIIIQESGLLVFTYLNGGANVQLSNEGSVNTLWSDYGRTVYFEPMLGGQVQGQTFNGMVFGTPLGGDLGDIVTPDHTGGVQGQDQPNPWTSDCSLLGKSAVMLRLQYNATYYKGGLPQISFLVHGKNDILDPRNSPFTTGYSTNAALCIADFLSNTTWGFKAAYGTEIPYGLLNAAANTCDEAVPLAYSPSSPPLTEPAYALNGQFELTIKRGEILQNMLTACAGRLTYISGQYAIWPAAWVGNSWCIGGNPGGGVVELPAYSQIAAGGLKWRIPSNRELYNGVKGTYISAANKWQSTDFPPYCQDAMHGYSGPSLYAGDINLAYDLGDRRWLDIQLPFTTSYSTAQRIAKIELLRRRNSAGNPRAVVTLTLNMVAYQIAPLDLLLLNIPYMGWTNKQFEVIDMRFAAKEGGEGEGPKLVVELDLQEVDTGIYDWSTIEELSPQGYVQPEIPGLASLLFFATELVPGYSVPYPWKPAYIGPLVGDAMWPTPVIGTPKQNLGPANFGTQVVYDIDASGNPTANINIQGVLPPNQLESPVPPQYPPQLSCVVGTSGNLPPGKYFVGVSGIQASNSANTALSTLQAVTIPESSPPANNGSIAVTVTLSFGLSGCEIYMGIDSPENGLYFQASSLDPNSGLTPVFNTQTFGATPPDSSTISGMVITLLDFDQSTPGAPDASLDHLAIAWKEVIHGGVFAAQVQDVSSDTVTLGGYGMTLNQWAGYTLSLIGKYDPTQEQITLNMPIASSSASAALSPGTSTQAQVVGTFTGLPTDGETVTVAGKTYTFQATLTNTDGNVLIGSTIAACVLNLTEAINLDPNGAGSLYAAAMTANQNAYADPDVTGLSEAVICYSIIFGPGGNLLTASGSAPVSWSNGGSFAGGSSPDEFVCTIGTNSNGDQLPDLTTLLQVGDLLVMRFNPTFTPSSFTDPNIANPYYPQGATGVEPGHLVMVMTGPDAGDVQTVSAVSQDVNGNYTVFDIAGQWGVTPNAGDIIIIVAPAWGPEYHQPVQAAGRDQVIGTVASPSVTNLAGQTWLFIVRTQSQLDDNGLDSYAPIKEVYLFGSQGTRVITSSQTMLPTDRILDCDASILGALSPPVPLVITLLPFAQIPNQSVYIQKIDEGTNPVIWQCAGSPSEDNVNGQTSGELTIPESGIVIVVSGNG